MLSFLMGGLQVGVGTLVLFVNVGLLTVYAFASTRFATS